MTLLSSAMEFNGFKNNVYICAGTNMVDSRPLVMCHVDICLFYMTYHVFRLGTHIFVLESKVYIPKK